jgi:hypothetical protein
MSPPGGDPLYLRVLVVHDRLRCRQRALSADDAGYQLSPKDSCAVRWTGIDSRLRQLASRTKRRPRRRPLRTKHTHGQGVQGILEAR